MSAETKRLRECLDPFTLQNRLAEASKDYMLWSRLLAIAEDAHAEDNRTSSGQERPAEYAAKKLQAVCEAIRSGDLPEARCCLQTLREVGVDLRLGCDVESEACDG